MTDVKEKLAVLDLPEEEQAHWVAKRFVPEYGHRISLADLAFRLRDEVVNRDTSNWGRAILKINIKCATSEGYESWWQNYAKPIHWIIAALIAKSLAKGE